MTGFCFQRIDDRRRRGGAGQELGQWRWRGHHDGLANQTCCCASAIEVLAERLLPTREFLLVGLSSRGRTTIFRSLAAVIDRPRAGSSRRFGSDTSEIVP